VRPTIPLSDWRLAVDLDATKSVKRQTGHPADGCACDQCVSWRSYSDSAFPASVRQQLSRLGVDPERPTDLYVTEESKDAIGFRVMYHIAGKIISGPAASHESGDDVLGTMNYYKMIQATPYASLRLTTAKQSYAFAPIAPVGSTSDILCLDFRISVARR
jgi:hypothetical protein